MAGYKVSYKVLKQQGEAIKATGKLVDGYAERANQICARLGDDEMLAEARNNLKTLAVQLGESRAILNTAGDLLAKSVEGYTAAETRQVKKVDATKAHNRDFYKNPVVVPSAGAGSGAAAAPVAAAAAAPAAPSPGLNYTDQSVTINYTAPADIPAASAQPAMAEMPSATVGAASATSPLVGAAAGVLGGAAVAGAAVAGQKLKKKKDAARNAEKSPDTPAESPSDSQRGIADAEADLQAAIRKVKELENTENVME